MKRLLLLCLLFVLGGSALAKTHHDMFNVPCSTLWPAVKDTLRNSGKYGIIGIDNQEMTASYYIGGYMGGKRSNALVLNSKGNECELQIQTVYSGMVHNDEGDFKKRVEESLKKLEASKGSTSGQPAAAGGGSSDTEAKTDGAGKASESAAPTPKQ
jgi:hypothetical protein